jgi:putative transposase
MYERSTEHDQPEKRQKVYTTTKASDPQRMGTEWKWSRGCRETPDSSSNPLSMEKGSGARCGNLSERQAPENESEDKGTRGRKPEAQGSPYHSDPRVDVVKKKDELGLTNRPKGATYGQVQRQRIIEEVENLKVAGIKKTAALKTLGVTRSTYYGWIYQPEQSKRRSSVLSLTEVEKQAVIDFKKLEPHLSHRKISGYLRHDGHWISSSSCYRILKALGWVLPQSLRKSPWSIAHYEPFRPNQLWGEDWTILTVSGLRYYLLTIIDYFSRYIIAWGIAKTVTHREIRNLLTLAYISEDIENKKQKPVLRTDRGSPNMAHRTKKVIKDLEMILSPGRANRPTDNARQERWYRTVKQEEIYCYPTYPSVEIARQSLARYIEEYNEVRPHQSLWNYTPGHVHRIGNKTRIIQHYKQVVQNVKEQRKRINQGLSRRFELTPFCP